MTSYYDSRGQKQLYIGLVVDSHPNAMFHIYVSSLKKLALGYVSGKMRESAIRIIRGDTVLIELSGYDQTRGRIVQRLDNYSLSLDNDSSDQPEPDKDPFFDKGRQGSSRPDPDPNDTERDGAS
uniref:Translation initiation factor 1 n=1 Tax=Halophila beccarii TaxID=180123 RepID=A0A7G7YEJ6_9LILI|nr:translation initiation factor 1 [Halophila beccarii]YP_009973465.1 translation initiation factor 1 [Halophila beccarii]QNH92885.1 translation initiation factor 1 [Halophila beccarii]QNH92916.1 translation initiation factor 1 [Halophila beccarii]